MTIILSRESRAAMERIVEGMSTKSEKIRALGAAGHARADIARFLGIRYQHVRNVLVEAEGKQARLEQADTVNADAGAGAGTLPAQVWTQVGPDGRVVVPAGYRRLLGVDGGGDLLMLLDDGEVRLLGRDGAIARAQALVAPFLGDESTSTEAFLAERRREARREEQGERSGG